MEGNEDEFDSFTMCMLHQGVENCSLFELGTDINLETFFCSRCNSGFYLNSTNKICYERVNLSDNCLTYEVTQDKCKTCKAGSFLVNTNKDCQVNPDGNKGCIIYQSYSTCLEC